MSSWWILPAAMTEADKSEMHAEGSIYRTPWGVREWGAETAPRFLAYGAAWPGEAISAEDLIWVMITSFVPDTWGVKYL